jgi:hypothetical protein
VSRFKEAFFGSTRRLWIGLDVDCRRKKKK